MATKIIKLKTVRVETPTGDMIDYLCESFELFKNWKNQTDFAILYLWNGNTAVLDDTNFKSLEVID